MKTKNKATWLLFLLATWAGHWGALCQDTQITSVMRRQGEVLLAWRGPAGWDHTVQFSPQLPAREWREVLTVPAALERNERPLALPGESYGFYRIRCAQRPGGPGPRLFFTDLESGPNSGGQDNLGCFITLWGEGFGTARGDSQVYIGGQEVGRYVEWGQDNGGARSLDMIVVQPGTKAASGNIEVVVNGQRSNPLPFTVRPGRILFVATTGNDANPGDFQSPWRTVTQAKNRLAPGDLAYVMDGVTRTNEETWSAALAIDNGGVPGAPKALLAYPGARVVIGATNLQYGIRVIDPEEGPPGDWVFSKLVLRAQEVALEVAQQGADRWRVIGNDLSCPYGDGQSGCFTAAFAQEVAFLGNRVHDTGTLGPQPSKQYHAVYFTTDTSHVEVGWNHIHDNRTCRAIQFHSSPLCMPDCGPTDRTGFNQHDLVVHDNLIHGDVCDGINFATVDPSQGPVLAYNNVIYDVGQGPPPPDGDANYAGIHVAGGTNNGRDGTGAVDIFNNTLFNCGGRKLLPDAIGDEGAFSRGPGSPELIMQLRNNIVLETTGEDYIAPSSATALIRGSQNLWFGAGAVPGFLATNLNADPMFANLTARDFHLRTGSPAIDAGAAAGSTRDHEGVIRPQGSASDIGAFEFSPSQSRP
ncbi:MAG: choice-of-anchor Q domain-containing protein [Verrucomicrobiia bacterium]